SWGFGGYAGETKKYGYLNARGPGKLELVQTLLKYGADPNARLKRNGVLHADGHFDQQNKLQGATPFVMAGTAAHLSVMRTLLAAGADRRATSDDGTNVLMLLAGLGKGPRAAEEIVPYSRSLEATKWAAEEFGMDINATNGNGETALHGATYYGAEEI